MSVRPISVSEETKAMGHPFVNLFALFGASQGLLIYLHRKRVPVTANLIATPGSAAAVLVLMGGGYLVGGGIALSIFADWNLVRLANQH